MRLYADELICSTGVSGFQTFKLVLCIYLIDFLVFGDPKLLYLTSTETTTWCGSKGGSGRRSAPLKLKRSAPCTPGFLAKEKTYHQGGTHTGMEEGVGPPPRADCDHSWVNMEGAQTDIGEGVGPPLRVGCDQSWASLGPN